MLNTATTKAFAALPAIRDGANAPREARAIAQRGAVPAEPERRAENARAMVRWVLQEHTAGRTLPVAVSTFLHYDWRAMLERLYMEYGVDSPEWIGAVQLVDDLVWLLQQHTDERSRRRLEWLLPDLYRRVNVAFDGSQGRGDGERTRLAALRRVLGLFPRRDVPESANASRGPAGR